MRISPSVFKQIRKEPSTSFGKSSAGTAKRIKVGMKKSF